jgi:hypothetical protein
MHFRRPTHWTVRDMNGAVVAVVRNPDCAAARVPRAPVAPLGGTVTPGYDGAPHMGRTTGYAPAPFHPIVRRVSHRALINS